MQSLWTATAPPAPDLPELRGAERARVLIIGAGYTGLSAALHLCEAGVEVVVLDAGALGQGGSGLNGGQVIPGVKLDPDRLERRFGAGPGAALVQTVAAGPELVFGLVQRLGIACEATRNGWLQAATEESALAPMQARVEQWRARGAPVSMLDRGQINALIGSERYCGGWVDRRGGTLQPLSYLLGLARAVRQMSARIYVHTVARSLQREGELWRVQTAAGEVRAETVLLATNAYSDSLVPQLRRSVIAVPSLQVATAALPPALLETILPGRQAVSDTARLLRYFRVTGDGRLALGSRGYFGHAPLRRVARHHYRAVWEIFPQLRDVGFDYHWGGLVAMTADHLPHLHEIGPGLLAGLGYNGRGVAMATMMGRLLARRVLGASSLELGFPITSLRPLALHRFSPLGVRLAVRYLQLRADWSRPRTRGPHP